jgi:hypothetical protein
MFLGVYKVLPKKIKAQIWATLMITSKPSTLIHQLPRDIIYLVIQALVNSYSKEELIVNGLLDNTK